MKKHLWLKWTLYCATGELIGIAMAGMIAFGANQLIGEPNTFLMKCVVLILMLTAGVIEGTLLGLFQWSVLVQKFRDIPRKEWLRYTILAAVTGWFLGTLPSLFFIPASESVDGKTTSIGLDNMILYALLSIGAGLLLGALFGLFQWFSLKKHVGKAYRWIMANSLGWGAGLGWIYLFASLPDESTGLAFNILMGISGGSLAGLSVGAITGLYLVKLKIIQSEPLRTTGAKSEYKVATPVEHVDGVDATIK